MIVVLALLCVVLQAGYGAAEVSLSGASRSRLEARTTAGDRGAARALSVLAHEDRMLAACLVGTALFAVLGTALCAKWLTQYGFASPWAAVVVYAPIVAIVGALLPRLVGPDAALAVAGPSARLVWVTQILLAPVVLAVEGWARVVSALSGSSRQTALSRQEIVLLLGDPAEDSGIDPDEKAMIQRVFALPEIAVSECMTPLVDVAFVRAEASLREAIAVALSSGHTRLPVADGRVDHIVGVLHVRDLLFGGADDRRVREVMRPARYVPESKRLHELIHEMRREREPFAILVDEYGGSVGIVSIEDLLEEIIGDIRDEREVGQTGVRQLADGEWRASGRVEIGELSQVIGRVLPNGDYETVAGLILAQLGRIPRTGETAVIGDLVFRVEDADERSVRSVHVSLRPAS